MSRNDIDKKLDGLLGETFIADGNGNLPPYREHRIHTNRNIKLARIQAIGFDMDYTLAQYQQEALEKLTMEMGLEIMVNEKGYPEGILEIPYNGTFAIRGLIVDTELGNVLKMDKFRYVSLAYHGLKPLSADVKAKRYNIARINYNSGRYRSVDTLFELLETYLYAAIIDYLENGQKARVDYTTLYQDLRGAIDLCHRDGRLKNKIMAQPELYICDDLLLIPTLHQFVESGKTLFVVTNSEPEYTNFVLNYLFRNAAPFFNNWRSCFDIVCASSFKPKFFMEGVATKIIEDKDALFFSGGNLAFLEEKLGIKGDQILYVGDHIYGDILKSKHNSTWRTCMVVPELRFQIRAEQAAKAHLKALLTNEARRKHLNMELNWRRTQMHDLQQFKEAEADELDLDHLKRIDDRITLLNRQLEDNHKELSLLLFESRRLRQQISSSFNPYWGRLFKTGGQLSIFAEQIRDYACIYTSSVSNFNYYGTQCYLESAVTPMPHEEELYSVGDLNFDVPIEAPSDQNLNTLNLEPEQEQVKVSD